MQSVFLRHPSSRGWKPDKSGTANMWRSKGSIARGLAPYIPALKDRVLRRVGIKELALPISRREASDAVVFYW